MSWFPCKLLAWNAESGSTQVAANHASCDMDVWRCLDQLQTLCSVMAVQLRSDSSRVKTVMIWSDAPSLLQVTIFDKGRKMRSTTLQLFWTISYFQ